MPVIDDDFFISSPLGCPVISLWRLLPTHHQQFMLAIGTFGNRCRHRGHQLEAELQLFINDDNDNYSSHTYSRKIRNRIRRGVFSRLKNSTNFTYFHHRPFCQKNRHKILSCKSPTFEIEKYSFPTFWSYEIK